MHIFITGTDTDVGKTVVSAWICAQTGFSYWKPIQAGFPTDTHFLNSITRTYPESYVFNTVASPHAAARIEGRFINIQSITLPSHESMLIEGAGGILSPMADQSTNADFIVKFNLPTILVARSTLGTINHTCLALEAMRSRNIHILGVITNGPVNESNTEAIEHFGKINVLGHVPLFSSLSPSILKNTPLPEPLITILGNNYDTFKTA